MTQPRFLLDTNICIYIRQKRPPKVLARFEKLAPGEAVLSVVTYGELWYGAAKSAQRQLAMERLGALVSFLPVVGVPPAAAEEYCEIRATLEKKGAIIGGNDLWIAAHARASGLVLVTNDARGFERIPGLKLQNWAA